MKKFWAYTAVIAISIVLACSGVFCGISWFKKAHAKSHIIGTLDFDNRYTMESFSFSNAKHPIAFDHDEGNLTDWYFEDELEKVPTFDGDKKQYEIELNNYLILDAKIMFRRVSFDVSMNYRDLDASIKCEGSFNIVISFFNDKTTIRIETRGDKFRQFLEQYILENGFELFIKEVK